MIDPTNNDLLTDVQLALIDAYPNSAFGAIPIAEQLDALVSYRAADAAALAEIPGAYAAHLDYQRKQWG
jgi:hypothetical protein